MNIEEISIHIHTGANNRYWAEISQATPRETITLWEQVETSETLQEAFDRALNVRDKIIAAEEEEIQEPKTCNQTAQELGVRGWN